MIDDVMRLSPPMFLHTSAQSDLLSHLGADGVGEDDLGQIGFDGADSAACRQRADVHHQNLVLRQFLDLKRIKEVVMSLFIPNKNSYSSDRRFFNITPLPVQRDYISHDALLTLAAFLSPSVRTPSSLLSRK